MSGDYVQKVDGAWKIGETRVSLDSVVYAFLEGLSPESIADKFPALSLEQVYGAIAFYLSRRDEVDEYLREGEALFEERRREARAERPLLYQKLAALKQQRRQKTA
jgi:uncharacterized protein (DUF433 family)